MNIREQLEYISVISLQTLCRLLPEAWIYATFKGLGILSHTLMRKRRSMALLNTEIAFPEKPLAERKRIVRQHFINIAESMALNALITSGRITNERLLSMVEVDDMARFTEIRNSSPTGALFFSAHMGNWELMPQFLGISLPKPLLVIARQSNNTLLEERVIRPLRERFGVNITYKKNAMMRMVRAMKSGSFAGLLIDQRLNRREGVRIKFFGREAGTTATSALLQLRFHFTTVPIFMIRTGHQRYRFLIGEPVQWHDNGTPMDEQVMELTQIHQSIIENIIRQYPDQWFWMHNRWGLKQNET